jgi:hypothetical protein
MLVSLLAAAWLGFFAEDTLGLACSSKICRKWPGQFTDEGESGW